MHAESDKQGDPTEKAVEPLPPMSFEGIPVTGMEGVLPSITLDMPEGYPLGTHLRFEVEVRIANVRYEEGKGRKRSDFIRRHVFATEGVTLAAAFVPGEAASAPVGSAAGSAGLLEDEELAEVQEAVQTPVSVPEASEPSAIDAAVGEAFDTLAKMYPDGIEVVLVGDPSRPAEATDQARVLVDDVGF